MNKTVLLGGTLQAALIVIGSAIATGSVAAQEVREVTVEAPREVTRTVERTGAGVPVETVTLTRRVSYADLDLAKTADAATLEARISDTAKEACKQLDTLFPMATQDPDCVRKAVDGAMAQAKAAIAAAQK